MEKEFHCFLRSLKERNGEPVSWSPASHSVTPIFFSDPHKASTSHLYLQTHLAIDRVVSYPAAPLFVWFLLGTPNPSQVVSPSCERKKK